MRHLKGAMGMLHDGSGYPAPEVLKKNPEYPDAFTFFDGTPVPKSARLLNSGEALGIRFETLPDAMVFETGKAGGPFASIFGINGDDYPLELIVIEVEW